MGDLKAEAVRHRFFRLDVDLCDMSGSHVRGAKAFTSSCCRQGTMTPNEIPIGEVLAGKYKVERLLGCGGMGMVVAANHLELDDRVALKLLLPEFVRNKEFVTRFLTEARAARKLKSEHVAKVLDVGTLPDTNAPFMVMELLEGEDVSARIRKFGPLESGLAVACILQALEALAEAHRKGIIHRDVKPANLFLTRRTDGSLHVKMLDFGIAKMPAEDGVSSNVTRTQAMIGTAQYASPEQLMSPKHVDVRTDIWSMGATLFKMITGECPFTGEDLPNMVASILAKPPHSLSELKPDIDPQLSAVIERCLEKNPEARYSDVSELASALEPFAPSEARVYPERILRTLDPQGVFTGERPKATARTPISKPIPVPPSEAVVVTPPLPDSTLIIPDTAAFPKETLAPTGISQRMPSLPSGRHTVIWPLSAVLVLLLVGSFVILRFSPPKTSRATASGESPIGTSTSVATDAESSRNEVPPTTTPSPSSQPSVSASPSLTPSALALPRAPIEKRPPKPTPSRSTMPSLKAIETDPFEGPRVTPKAVGTP
jgi:eukaryotic-like serine/threonine-protein kinase